MVFTKEQKCRLVEAYEEHGPYPTESSIYNELSQELGVTRQRVYDWFRNCRNRSKNFLMLTTKQRSVLERVLKRNQHPSEDTYHKLARKLKLSEQDLRMWFAKKQLSSRVYKTNFQKEELKHEFERNRFPNSDTYQALAKKLKLSVVQVRKWFQTARDSKKSVEENYDFHTESDYFDDDHDHDHDVGKHQHESNMTPNYEQLKDLFTRFTIRLEESTEASRRKLEQDISEMKRDIAQLRSGFDKLQSPWWSNHSMTPEPQHFAKPPFYNYPALPSTSNNNNTYSQSFQ